VALYRQLIKRAEEAEKTENLDDTIKLYQDAIKAEASYAVPYERLMKNYQEELKVINEGIKCFQELHENKQKELTAQTKRLPNLVMHLLKV